MRRIIIGLAAIIFHLVSFLICIDASRLRAEEANATSKEELIASNEEKAQDFLVTIFTACYSYKNINGRYPRNLDVLTKETPPYLPEEYSDFQGSPLINGYIFEYSFDERGLPVVCATPALPGKTGIKYYVVDGEEGITYIDVDKNKRVDKSIDKPLW